MYEVNLLSVVVCYRWFPLLSGGYLQTMCHLEGGGLLL